MLIYIVDNRCRTAMTQWSNWVERENNVESKCLQQEKNNSMHHPVLSKLQLSTDHRAQHKWETSGKDPMLFSCRENSIVFMEASTASEEKPSSTSCFKVLNTRSSTQDTSSATTPFSPILNWGWQSSYWIPPPTMASLNPLSSRTFLSGEPWIAQHKVIKEP